MTKGTNKSIYKFKVTHSKSLNVRYYCTGDDLCAELGFPRNSVYYSLKHKGGVIADYTFERIYLPIKLLASNGIF
jgi:hypothetical protein